jgi:hypothetical protein
LPAGIAPILPSFESRAILALTAEMAGFGPEAFISDDFPVIVFLLRDFVPVDGFFHSVVT